MSEEFSDVVDGAMSIFSEGQVYFVVTFVDRPIAVPVIQTIKCCEQSESRE